MEEERRAYMAEEWLKQVDPNEVDRWTVKDPSTQMTPEQVDEILEAGKEIYISHLTSDGFPMITVHAYCRIDGQLWSSSVEGRVKVAAFRRDPRCGLCLSTMGLDVSVSGAVSLRTRAEVIEDRAVVERVCRAHAERYHPDNERARELFFESLLTPKRVALRFHIDKIVSWTNIGKRKS